MNQNEAILVYDRLTVEVNEGFALGQMIALDKEVFNKLLKQHNEIVMEVLEKRREEKEASINILKKDEGFADYLDLCLLTESKLSEETIRERFSPEVVRTLHAVMGLATEAGELLDNLKIHLFYGKGMDKLNLIEEAGDIHWYLSLLIDSILDTSEGIDKYNLIQKRNIAKLSKRYQGQFDAYKAVNRNLQKEREVFESAKGEKGEEGEEEGKAE